VDSYYKENPNPTVSKHFTKISYNFLRNRAERQRSVNAILEIFIELVSWSLTSLFSTNMAISETKNFH